MKYLIVVILALFCIGLSYAFIANPDSGSHPDQIIEKPANDTQMRVVPQLSFLARFATRILAFKVARAFAQYFVDIFIDIFFG